MDNDDLPVGRILTRRDAVRLLAGTTLIVVGGRRYLRGQTAAAVAPACVAKPELTEGPYFVDEKLNRSDIRGEPSGGVLKSGVPLALTFAVSSLGGAGCAP